jgi:superfamily II DNA/RNA helicase
VLGAHGGSAIVFHRTKHGARKLARDLERHGHRSSELQGNLSQNARDRAISDFRALRTDVLVATNVAARGLDIEHVRLVVNYELPESAQWLTHRVGRTARNGVEGRALTFLSDDDLEQWRKLRRDGAPDLPWIDLDILVDTGSMRPAPHSAAPAAALTAAVRSPRPAPAQRVLQDRTRRDRPSLPARAPLAARSPLPARSRHVAGQRRPAGAHAQQQGVIGKLVADRGFGFITGDDGEKYFFHRSAARDGFDTLRGGERVSFVAEAGAKGRRAAAVTLTRS